jgi:hypothetical protein
VERAVRCEPISGVNSLISREKTGNLLVLGIPALFLRPKKLGSYCPFRQIPYRIEQGIGKQIREPNSLIRFRTAMFLLETLALIFSFWGDG